MNEHGKHPSIRTASANSTLDGDVLLPLYRRLQTTIARKISEGEYKPGSALPAELEIARFYDVAPGTARKAIDELVSDGLLERRHGAGTFVRRPNFNNSMLRFFRFRDAGGKELTPDSRIIDRTIEPASDDLAKHLALQVGDNVIHMRRLRLWEGKPRLLEDIYLPLALFRPILDLDETTIGPLLYPAYEVHCDQLVSFVREEISISDADREDAAVLELDGADMVVTIDRLAMNPLHIPIEWRRSRGEARRFHYMVGIT
ncbi:GntR family transcriptional regulator [Agrobacterium tumefaciens]|uniref:GntR family transcriptional regulator n=1 Tax=Agrobacterium tumefaciens TaxID=358 RepID=UPI001571A57E|nr:GntR family transcriptional regulator [Agrobacterium tumefaciens]MCZ7497351.1 GntR family transcriptional regulator [Rhizobium rhizogenes]NTE56565.1 GntR family transcriptional regulator [Agrobacterium tumefaciens]NTE74533.1 GntR family transcriptional regulator [Agrobacterium tumefaciens]